MQYIHDIRQTKLHHEKSAFEIQLDALDNQANRFHTKRQLLANGINMSDEERQTLKKDMHVELKHLERERRFAETIGVVQARLTIYRNQGRKNTNDTRKDTRKKQSMMGSESHHPTATLEMFLRAIGRPKPSPKHTAHHISPGTGKTVAAAKARVLLHLHGIRINDPDNGVWMIRLKKHKSHWSMQFSKSHLEIHTKNYEDWIFKAIDAASDEKKCRQNLRLRGQMLEEGTQPSGITMPPSDSWNT